MAAHRYWRLVGFAVAGAGPLELSEVQLYAGGARVGDTVVPTCPFTPASGALADLSDGLATGVVAWPSSAHRAPGFALVWDLTGAGADVTVLRLGSGNSAATFPQGVTAQWSDDGKSWVGHAAATAIKYPGANSLTSSMASAVVDDFVSSVTLKLQCDGVNNSTDFQDGSPMPTPVTPLNGAKISTAVSRNGGASLLLQSGAVLSVAHTTGLDLSSGDFTVELWVYKTDSRDVFILDKDGAKETAYAQWALLCVGGKLQFRVGSASLASTQNGTCATNIPLNQWAHLAFTRSVSTLRLFVNGNLDGAGTFTQSVSMADGGRPLIIGNSSGQVDWFGGYMDDISVTKGVARYTASFTPPALLGDSGQFVEADVSPMAGKWKSSSVSMDIFSGASLPNGAASSHLREYAFFDAYHGGLGIIYGTVKEKNTPANTPLRRKVWLMDERSGLVIRETWSDAATGAYEFRSIKQGTPYTVLAYDHAHSYRAFAGDNLLPDPMP